MSEITCQLNFCPLVDRPGGGTLRRKCFIFQFSFSLSLSFCLVTYQGSRVGGDGDRDLAGTPVAAAVDVVAVVVVVFV